MAERTCNPAIDRAIVVTQYDLRGFYHPLGFRMQGKNAKYLDAITGNLMAFIHKDNKAAYARYQQSSYEEYLEMCKRIRIACDDSQAEAIQLIIKDIISYNQALREDEKEKISVYLGTLERNNRWGKAVLCLMEAFDVKATEGAAA